VAVRTSLFAMEVLNTFRPKLRSTCCSFSQREKAAKMLPRHDPPYAFLRRVSVREPLRIVFFGLLLLLAGCRSGETGGLVRGKVTYKGKALGEGSVVFHSTAGGQVCGGAVKPDGTFQLASQSKSDLIPIGEYVGVVFADNTKIAAMKEDPSFPVQPSVPFKFSSVTTSPLKYQVVLGENDFDIDLDKFPK
jgi:hypothetical protein